MGRERSGSSLLAVVVGVGGMAGVLVACSSSTSSTSSATGPGTNAAVVEDAAAADAAPEDATPEDGGGDAADGGPAAFGGPCTVGDDTTCLAGLFCLAGPGASPFGGDVGFCTKTCPKTSSAACTATPAGTAAFCVVTDVNSSGDKGCAFACRHGAQTYPCPGKLACQTTQEPAGSGQYLCLP